MATIEKRMPQVTALADRLLNDIRQRRMAVGDRYLTTEEVGRMLGVRKAVAGKAIRLLADREILIPRQRTGTFVGPGLSQSCRSKVRTVHVLLPSGDPSGTHWAYQPFIAGMRKSLPDANVQFAFIPEGDPLPYVQELIEQQRASGQFLGVVAVSCPPEVYRYLSMLRIPAVVSGSLYSSALQLSSVDLDNRSSGRLIMRYLIERGHRRIAMLNTSAGRPGDNNFVDGIADALSDANLPPNALVQRLVRNDIEALRAIAHDLFCEPNRPTAALTRGTFQAAALTSAATAAGLAVPKDLEIVFDYMDETTPVLDPTKYPRVLAAVPFIEHAAMIGKLLHDIVEGVQVEPRHLVVPVEFRGAEP
jgi:LacI family transcriptional regulator